MGKHWNPGWWPLGRPRVAPTVAAGDPAPDWSFTAAGGQGSLAALWSEGPLVVVWLRHYG